MKKILIFSLNYYPKFVGGAEVAIKEIVERQDKNKYEFHLITLRFDSDLPKEEVIHGIYLHRIGFARKNASISDLKKFPLRINHYYYQIFAGFYAIRLHLKYRFDAAWSMMPSSTGVPLSFLKLFTFGKIFSIVSFQEGDPIPHILKKVLPGFPFFWYSVKSADVVQTISTFLLNWARQLGYIGYGTVIPNGVDISKFTRNISSEEINTVKEKLGKKEGQVWLVTTSRLVHKNGVDNVIEALKNLDTKYYFAVLGIGPEEEKYKRLAKDLGVSNRVVFVGEVKHPEMATYLKAGDIFIRPSRSEGMGNSFVEAMSMKLPVIATTEGGLSDFIFQGKTAFVCEKDNPESIVKAIKKIEQTSYLEMENILNASYDMVLEKYNWDVIANRMKIEVFDRIY